MTKYLAGHSDVVLGATVVADTDRGREIGERLRRHRTLHGAIAGPMEVYLALRGLRTLSCASSGPAPAPPSWPAGSRATRPSSGCATPGLGRHARDRRRRRRRSGRRVCAAARLWLHSTSLGGVESQVERRRRHPSESEQVPDNLLRLSVGIEHVDDLWADLDQALDAAQSASEIPLRIVRESGPLPQRPCGRRRLPSEGSVP